MKLTKAEVDSKIKAQEDRVSAREAIRVKVKAARAKVKAEKVKDD